MRPTLVFAFLTLLLVFSCVPRPEKMAHRGIYGIRSATGVLMIWNSPLACFTFELPGREFSNIEHERFLVVVDGKVIQPTPFSRRTLVSEPGADIRSDKELLRYLASREGTYISGLYDAPLDLRLEEVTLNNGQPALYWWFNTPADTGNSIKKQLNLNVVQDSLVLLLNTPLLGEFLESDLKNYLVMVANSVQLSSSPINPDSVSNAYKRP